MNVMEKDQDDIQSVSDLSEYSDHDEASVNSHIDE
jgi:hypothetical protein